MAMKNVIVFGSVVQLLLLALLPAANFRNVMALTHGAARPNLSHPRVIRLGDAGIS
jgi:hypothetical protein